MHHIKTTSDLRIIPAFAGNTFLPVLPNPPREDHPRFRGEHILSHSLIRSVIGSSPLSRGTLGKSFRRSSLSRIIPAFAGNTNSLSFLLRRVQDHPRFRGEHTPATATMRSSRGSSPLSRGTPLHVPQHAAYGGIIPAFAGNTKKKRAEALKSEDHPRFRGEHLGRNFVLALRQGSSPLSRGTQHGGDTSITTSWIIPAFAGNTG